MATVLRTIASIFGTLSIFTWLFAQAPQIIKNFRRRSTLGLSMWFIIYWFIGDVTNLCGGLIAGTTWTQIAQATYFIVVDFILVAQWFTFHHRIWPYVCRYFTDTSAPEGTLKDAIKLPEPQNKRVRAGAVGPEELVALAPFALASVSLSSLQAGEGTLGMLWGYFGAALGYLSAICYLASRAPQVWRNFRIRSVEGIAPMMFVMAVWGNGSYVLSIIFAAPYEDDASAVGKFYWAQTPWILGSAGTFLFDFTIILQIVYFNILVPKVLRRGKKGGQIEVPTDAIELKTPPDFTLNHTPEEQSDPSVVIDSDLEPIPEADSDLSRSGVQTEEESAEDEGQEGSIDGADDGAIDPADPRVERHSPPFVAATVPIVDYPADVVVPDVDDPEPAGTDRDSDSDSDSGGSHAGDEGDPLETTVTLA